jgi:predicted secreted protein
MSESMITDSATLNARLHKPFEIVLRSKAVSGYEWRPSFNSTALRLVARRYSRPKANAFGASGQEVFKFEPLKPGNHDITFVLVRPLEDKTADTRAFALHVT